MTEDRFEKAIDEAVRQIMSVDAGVGFRAEVLTRIDRPSSRWPPRPVFVVLAAAAALVLGVMLTRTPGVYQSPRELEGEHATRSTAAPPGAAQRVPPTEQLAPPAPTVAARPPSRPRPAARPNATPGLSVPGEPDTPTPNDASPEPAVVVAALPPIEPIAVAPPEASPIVPEDIVIEPLAPIAQLRVERVTTMDYRN